MAIEWKAIFLGVVIGAAAGWLHCQMMAKGGFQDGIKGVLGVTQP